MALGYTGLAILLSAVSLIALRMLWPEEHTMWKEYRCRALKPTEITTAHNFLLQHLGPDIATPQQMAEWLATVPDLFWVIERRMASDHGPTYCNVGYFEVLPLRSGAHQSVREGLLDATGFRPEHFLKKRGSVTCPHSLYQGL